MRRAMCVFLWAALAVFLLAGIAMWVRSELIAYDLVWLWTRTDCRWMLNSHRGMLFLYCESTEGGDSEATGGAWCLEHDRLGYWSLPVGSTIVQWDDPGFEHSLAGVTWGDYTFLADAPTRHTGIGIPYWMLLLLLSVGSFSYLAIRSIARTSRLSRTPESFP